MIKVTDKHVVVEITDTLKCIYFNHGLNISYYFDFYKNDTMIKSVYSDNFENALQEFNEWYKKFY